MSVWGKAAGAVLGGAHDAQQERDQRELRALQRAQLLAALSEQGYGMGEAPTDPGAEMLSGQGVDDAVSAATAGLPGGMASVGQQAAKRKRYDQITPGKRGVYRDVTMTPEARRQRAEDVVAQRQEDRDRRTLERQTALENLRAKNQRKPQQHVVDPVTGKVTFYDPTDPPAELTVHPQPRDAFSFPVVTGEDGKNVVARANTKTGEIEPTTIGARSTAIGGWRGAATLQKAVATNTKQIAVIDDALKELEAHPEAVGMLEHGRGLPFVSDQLDQRVDSAGVAARASVANIGSLQIHDRTGAAMTVHEEPRLAPFVPNIRDTPATIRTKLRKLRESINVETDALRSGGSASGNIHHAPSHAAQLWDAAVAKHGKQKVLDEYGPRPQEEE